MKLAASEDWRGSPLPGRMSPRRPAATARGLPRRLTHFRHPVRSLFPAVGRARFWLRHVTLIDRPLLPARLGTRTVSTPLS